MTFLDKAAAEAVETGTVVELADGRRLAVDAAAEESYDISETSGVLTVVTVEGDRRLQRRYSPLAWLSVIETSEPRGGSVSGVEKLVIGGAQQAP